MPKRKRELQMVVEQWLEDFKRRGKKEFDPMEAMLEFASAIGTMLDNLEGRIELIEARLKRSL